MKLLRHGPQGQEKPGLLDARGRIRDLSDVVPDIAGPFLNARWVAHLRSLDPETLPLVAGKPRLGPCIGSVSKVIGVGLNYADHAAEAGVEPPLKPTLFMKAPSSISGPDDDLVIPLGSDSTDWEVELALVIGEAVRHVTAARALDHLAGYCVANDVTERAWVASSGQLLNGKCADSFTPLGPWLVTPDEIGTPQDLDLTLKLNGTQRQSGNTRTMVFPVAELVSHISRCMTLLPGDVILTGTPPGTGMRSKPQRYLQVGDDLDLEITGLGQQRHRVAAASV
ncbi:MAG TPA: fumarylacetoacetate hydrolase family protein [Kiloniellales bacterium]|jgi:ureidoglycolate lyase